MDIAYTIGMLVIGTICFINIVALAYEWVKKR